MTKSPELSTENYRSSKARVRQVLLIKVTRTRYFAAKATVWLSPGNQNYLRITRIRRCLSPELTYEGMPVTNGQDARLAWESLLRDTGGYTNKSPHYDGADSTQAFAYQDLSF